MLSSEASIAVGEGAVWVITAEEIDKTLTRFNAQTGIAEAKISLPSGSSSVVVDYGSVWATGYGSNELYRINPRNNTVTSITKLHAMPRSLTSGEGSIWVFNQGDLSVQRIDPKTGELIATIETELPSSFGDITTGGGYVWVSMPGAPVAQIDPRTNTLTRRFIGGHGIGGLIYTARVRSGCRRSCFEVAASRLIMGISVTENLREARYGSSACRAGRTS